MLKGVIAQRKASEKKSKRSKRSKSVDHVGTSLNAKPMRVQSMDQVKRPPPVKRSHTASIPRPPPVKGPSPVKGPPPVKLSRPPPVKRTQKAKSFPNRLGVELSPPSPQKYGIIMPNRAHSANSKFRRYTQNDPYPPNKPGTTRRFRRPIKRFVWAEEPDHRNI